MARTKSSAPPKPAEEEVYQGDNSLDSETAAESTEEAAVPGSVGVFGEILIKPTIGRMVLYNDGFSDQQCAAQIAYVHNDNLINIGYLDRQGMNQSRANVTLIQDSNLECKINECEWMEYQKNQTK